ncbi:unnamed protein product [Sphagnum jensenii]|uniref:Uncharacterized protein n=1 Tax=Sphagnum jensenii TaxID=128206 RepID=A0ABP0WM09_9BRYO
MWKMGLSGAFKKEGRETFQSIVSTVSGVPLGIAIGVSFMKFGIVSNIGLLFNQQHAADAQVQLQEQDDCRYVTCPGAQPVGTELLPEDIIAPLSDLYPHGLWGKPEEDLPHRPKYLLTLTVGLKRKDFVNQWYAKRFSHPDIVEPYEYIFIWDDDLDVMHFDAEKYVLTQVLTYMQSFKNHGLEISQPGLKPGQEEQWSRTVGVKIPISPHVQGMSFSEHFNFCSMVTNEVVLHELCMYNEMMDIQLGYVFVVAGL